MARLWDMTHTAEVVGTHAGLEHEVAFQALPGFAYCTGLPDRLWVPRRHRPCPSRGSARWAVADLWTGVYSTSSPGGWRCSAAPRCSCGTWRARRARDPVAGTRVRLVATRARAGGRGPGAADHRPGPRPPLCTRRASGRLARRPCRRARQPAGRQRRRRRPGDDAGGVTVRTTAAMTVAVTGAECALRVAAGPALRDRGAGAGRSGWCTSAPPGPACYSGRLGRGGRAGARLAVHRHARRGRAAAHGRCGAAGGSCAGPPVRGRRPPRTAHGGTGGAARARRTARGPGSLGRARRGRPRASGPRRSAPTGWLCASTARPCPVTTARSRPKAWCSGRSRCRHKQPLVFLADHPNHGRLPGRGSRAPRRPRGVRAAATR